jgi:hypothetical protein
MALDRLKPDTRQITLFDGRLTERHKDHLGYKHLSAREAGSLTFSLDTAKMGGQSASWASSHWAWSALY